MNKSTLSKIPESNIFLNLLNKILEKREIFNKMFIFKDSIEAERAFKKFCINVLIFASLLIFSNIIKTLITIKTIIPLYIWYGFSGIVLLFSLDILRILEI